MSGNKMTLLKKNLRFICAACHAIRGADRQTPVDLVGIDATATAKGPSPSGSHSVSFSKSQHNGWLCHRSSATVKPIKLCHLIISREIDLLLARAPRKITVTDRKRCIFSTVSIDNLLLLFFFPQKMI